MIKTPKTEQIFNTWKQIKENDYKIIFVEKCVHYLKYCFDEVIVNMLMELGFDQIVDKEDYNEYYKQIELLENEAAFLHTRNNQLWIEYKSLVPDDKNEVVKRTEMDFERELMMLSKYQGTLLNKDTLTVFEFAAIYNNYIDEVNRSKR